MGSTSPPEFVGFLENFPYPAGNLNGQNGWADLGGESSFWTVSSAHVTIAAPASTAGSTKSLTPYGFAPNVPFTLAFNLKLHSTIAIGPTFIITIGTPASPQVIGVTIQQDVLGADQILINVDTQTQNANATAAGFSDDFDFPYRLQYDGTDLILFLNNIEQCRITGALFPGVNPILTFEAANPSTTTVRVGTIQITEP